MSGPRDWRHKGCEYIPFIPNKKATRIPLPQRPVVVDQEAFERRRECIRSFYRMAGGSRDKEREIVLPTQEEFDRALISCEGAYYWNGFDDPAHRSVMERMVREVLREEEIKDGDGEKVGPKDSEKKDLIPKNDKEEDGDVVKGEMMKSVAKIQEADKKGITCPGDRICVEGHVGRSLAEEGEATLATGDTECSKNGRDRAEDLEMPMGDEEGNAEHSDEVKTVVDVEKQSSAVKNGDEGIVGNAEVKLKGSTSSSGGEEQLVGAEIEAEAPAPEAEGHAVAAAAIEGQNGNEGIPQGQEEFPDFQTAKALKFGEVIRRLRR